MVGASDVPVSDSGSRMGADHGPTALATFGSTTSTATWSRSSCSLSWPPLAARLGNHLQVDDQEQDAVWVCSRLRAPWPVLWPRLRDFG
jgi:hypothetical protein